MNAVFEKKRQAARTDESVQAWINHAFDLFHKGSVADAAKFGLKALKVQPRHFDVLHLMGVIAQQQHDPIQAIRWFKKALAVNSNHAAAYLNLGNAHHEIKQYPEALAQFDQALKLEPQFYKAHHNKSLVLREMGLHAQALSSIKKSLEITGIRCGRFT